MVTAVAATWDRERFQRNVAALAGLQPELARRLTDLELPDAIKPARGRDGTPTFRVLAEDQRWRWLGRTSMPSISGPALIEHFGVDGTNALIPMLGTGAEADLLCKRLPRHCAVFAYEGEPVNVKLALHVTDLAQHFGDGRLVLLTFDPIEDMLPAFLGEHPGYEFPHRMLVHPAVSKAAFDGLRHASEAAAASTSARRWEIARSVAATLTGRDRPTVGDRPRVVLLSSDPRPGPMATVAQLAGALARLDWPAVVEAPSSPAKCHNVARLISIRDHRPDLVLWFNSGAGRLRDYLPAGQPVASWFWPSSAVDPAVAEGHGPPQHLFAVTPALCAQLQDAGAGPDVVHLLEVGVDTSVFRPAPIDPPRRAALSCDVALLVDATDGSAAAAGIRQHSQVVLWEKLREVTARRAHEYAPSRASRMVAEAERDTGIKIASQDVRQKFVQLLRRRLAGTAVARAAVVALRSAGFSVKVWGNGWGKCDDVGDLVAGPIPGPSDRNNIYQCARAVVFPSFETWTALGLLEVTAAGGVVIFRAPEADLTALHPQTADVFTLLPQYGGVEMLLRLVGEAGVSRNQQAANVAAARRRIVAEHSLVRRWRTIRDTLRCRD